MQQLHRRKDIQPHGDYHTRFQILEVCDAMRRAIDTGESDAPLIDSPPGTLRVVHGESNRSDWAKGDG